MSLRSIPFAPASIPALIAQARDWHDPRCGGNALENWKLFQAMDIWLDALEGMECTPEDGIDALAELYKCAGPIFNDSNNVVADGEIQPLYQGVIPYLFLKFAASHTDRPRLLTIIRELLAQDKHGMTGCLESKMKKFLIPQEFAMVTGK